MSSPGGKNKSLSLSEKMKLIEDHEKARLTPKDLIEKFKVGKTQVYATLKNKDKIMNEWLKGTPGHVTRVGKVSSNGEVNKAIWEWFLKARDNGSPISGPIIKAEALAVAQKLGKGDFKASNGWLESFKSRHNISFSKLGLRTPPECNENCWDQSLEENNTSEAIVILTEGSYEDEGNQDESPGETTGSQLTEENGEDATPCETSGSPKRKAKRVTRKKKKVVVDEDERIQPPPSAVINKDINSSTTDENSIFGEYVASELRQLHSEEKRRKLKRIIQRAIILTSEEDELVFSKQLTSDSE